MFCMIFMVLEVGLMIKCMAPPPHPTNVPYVYPCSGTHLLFHADIFVCVTYVQLNYDDSHINVQYVVAQPGP